MGDEHGGVAAVRANVLQHVEILRQHHHVDDGLGVNVCTSMASSLHEDKMVYKICIGFI